MRTTVIRGTTTAVLLCAAALTLSACANHEEPAPPGAGDSVSYGMPAPGSSATSAPTAPATADATHNAADVTFLDDVVLLRQQAASLASLATTNSTNAKVKALAGTFAGEIYPPVDTLMNWLTSWGQTTPTASGTTLTGLLSDTQLTALGNQKGTAFDSQWASDITANHNAVLQAANTEVSSGANAQAKEVAQNLVTSQQSELAQISSLGVTG